MLGALHFRLTFTRILFAKMVAYNTVVLRVVLCWREACSLTLSEDVIFHTVNCSSVGQKFCTIIMEDGSKNRNM